MMEGVDGNVFLSHDKFALSQQQRFFEKETTVRSCTVLRVCLFFCELFLAEMIFIMALLDSSL